MKKIVNIKYANEHERQVLDLYLPDKEEFETYFKEFLRPQMIEMLF